MWEILQESVMKRGGACVCESWKGKLKNLNEDYRPEDICSADESVLFYQCLPDKTLAFKDQDTRGGKHSKVRMGVLLATNSTGSDKLKPIVIGR